MVDGGLRMNIIDHGRWVNYKPNPIPEKAPPNALFCKRESDGQDWYLYVHAVPPPGVVAVNPNDYATQFNVTNFQLETVKFTALWQEQYGAYVVGAAVYDPLMLFPGGQLLGEITDYTGTDPQADFGNKVYDPETKTFSDPPPIEETEGAIWLQELERKILSKLDESSAQKIMGKLDEISARLTKLEAKPKSKGQK